LGSAEKRKDVSRCSPERGGKVQVSGRRGEKKWRGTKEEGIGVTCDTHRSWVVRCFYSTVEGGSMAWPPENVQKKISEIKRGTPRKGSSRTLIDLGGDKPWTV